MTPSPFSLEVGHQYARELAQKLARCPMNEQARKSEVKDFARLVIEIYRKREKDLSPSPSAPGRFASDGALNINGGN